MLRPRSPLTPPQTAAELLDRLLRSQLLAESLFGQVFEQSRPYLDRQADEYAAALVEKRVLSQWQAAELLAGRIGLYAGTFRLLARLVETPAEEWYAAEQPGPQRLVLLQVTPREGVPSLVVAPTSIEVGVLRSLPRHPGVGRCLEVQSTPQLQLVAYEFHEARLLSALQAERSIPRPHAADLLQQFISALDGLSNSILQSIDPESVWIDPHGQLRLLAGPNPWSHEQPPNESSPIREALQLAAAGRFASMVGGLPEVAECGSLKELAICLAAIAKPWTEPYASKSPPVQRSAVNRLLRRGPALSRIESLGPEFQLGYDGLLNREMPIHEPQGPEPSQEPPPVAPSPPKQTLVIPEEAEPPKPFQSPRPRRRVFAFAAAGLLLLACSAAAWWFEPWSVRRAGAAAESELPAAKPQTLNPEPSQRDRLPLPQ